MNLVIARQHESSSVWTIHFLGRLAPGYREVMLSLQDIFGPWITCEVDARFNKSWFLPGVVTFTTKGAEDTLVLRWDCHGVMGVHGVGLEMIGECSEEELVEDAT